MNISSSLRPPRSLRFGVLFSFWGFKAFLSLDPLRMETKRMTEEEAESAEILL